MILETEPRIVNPKRRTFAQLEAERQVWALSNWQHVQALIDEYESLDEPMPEGEVIYDSLIDSEPSPEEVAIQRDENAQYSAWLDTFLTPMQKVSLVLYHVRGLMDFEIAQRYGLATPTVTGHRQKAERRLQRAYGVEVEEPVYVNKEKTKARQKHWYHQKVGRP